MNADAYQKAARQPDAVARFALAASECGLIRPGDKLDRNLIDFAL